MIRKIYTALVALLRFGNRRKGLVVSLSPNYDSQATVVQHPPYRYMWFYRTEVRNTLEVPLRVVWFEGFTRVGWQWIPGNIMGRNLTGKDFSAWYSDGESIVNGVIPPGVVAVNACNWHGSNNGPVLGSVKWAYKAEDPSGVAYYADVVLERQTFIDVGT